MNVRETPLQGVVTIEPQVHGDARGFFLETYREDRYREWLGDDLRLVQHNHSRSEHGVLRGLHCQTRRPQGKLVRCLAGEIFDVVADINPESVTFGQWVGVVISAANHVMIWVPPGYVHGFQVLSSSADVEYKCSDYYDPGYESGLIWNDPEVAIDWPLAQPTLSAKDRELPGLDHYRR